MNKKKNDRKRMVASVIAIALVVIMLLGTFLPFIVRANEAYPITIEAKVGTNDSYKVGKTSNIEVLLTNNGEDFSGEIQVKINTSQNQFKKEYNVYAFDVELFAGSIQKHNLDVVFYTINRDVTINLVDKKNKVVSTKKVRAIPFSEENIFIGVFTDEESELDYLKDLSFFDNRVNGYSKIGENLSYIDIDGKKLNYGFFDNYSAVIINNFTTSKFDEQTLGELSNWVSSGGLLILGTGENQEKILPNINRYFGEISYVEDVLTKNIYSQDLLFEIKSETDILLAQFEGWNLSEIQNTGDQNKTASYMQPYGRGSIIIHGYDLASAPISENQATVKVLGELYAPYIYTNFDNLDQNYYGTSSISYLANIDETSYLVTISFVIILLYVLFIPILYFILKKIDKREKGWVIIPITSLSTILVVIIVTSGSKYQKPVIATTTTINLTNGESTGNGIINGEAFSSDSGTININFDSDVNATIPFEPDNYYNQTNNSKQKIVTEKDLTKTKYGDSTILTYYDKARWSSNSFNVEKQIDVGGSIEADLTIENGILKGKIYNNTDMYFEPLIINYFGLIENFGIVAPHDEVDVEIEATVNNSFISNNYDLARQMIEIDNNQDINYNSQEYRLKEFQMQMLNNYLDQKDTTGSHNEFIFEEINNVNIYAFSDLSFLGDNININNKKTNLKNLNLLVVDSKVKNNSNNLLIPFGLIKPEVTSLGAVNTSYGGKYNYSYDTIEFNQTPNDITAIFSLPDGKINSFIIDDISASLHSSVSVGYIFNHATDEWESLKTNITYSTNCEDYILDKSIVLEFRDYGEYSFEYPEIKLEMDLN